VDFYWEKPLARLEFDGAHIVSAFCDGERIQADAYILAINPFTTAEILSTDPELERQEQLKLFKPLVQGGPTLKSLSDWHFPM